MNEPDAIDGEGMLGSFVEVEERIGCALQMIRDGFNDLVRDEIKQTFTILETQVPTHPSTAPLQVVLGQIESALHREDAEDAERLACIALDQIEAVVTD
jgi:hypothetical protein